MRRPLAAITLAILASLAVAAPSLAAGPPEVVKLEPTMLTADDLAGTCDFPVQLVDTFSNSKQRTYPVDDAGDQRVSFGGGFRSTVTNLAGGASIDIRYFGAGTFWFRADGTVHIKASGSFILLVYEGDDLSMFDPGLYLITGGYESVADAATFFVRHSEEVRGKVVDLCASID